jgi:hypothetical protein
MGDDMALKAIIPKPSLSHQDIIQFALDLVEFVRENHVTSVGYCLCLMEDDKEMIFHHHMSLDPGDQINFETAALELRQSIIDSLDDWQIELYDDDK